MSNTHPPTITPFAPPRFSPDEDAGLAYLQEHGYAVFKGVASPQESSRATGLFWDFLEALGTGIRREDPETWGNDRWPESHKRGAIVGHNVGHSAFLWYCRGLEKVRRVFERAWGAEELLVSFDGCGAFRPTSYHPDWVTQGGWYHFDQNGAKKQGLHCYQGILNLLDAGPERGGLVVVPGSHLCHAEYFRAHPEAGRGKGDFIKLPHEHLDELSGLSPQKLCCEAGDLVLWDSRVAHCNTPALSRVDAPQAPASLERLVAYVCMTPLALATHPQKLLAERRRALEVGITTDHWPHEFNPNYAEQAMSEQDRQARRPYTPPVLNEAQRRLAGLPE